MENNYSCIKCNKNYANRQGLWMHNKRNHNEEIKESKSKSNKFDCKFCKKKLSNSSSKSRHEKKCEGTENSQLKNEIKILKEQYELMKKQLEDFINNNCKVHPKTLTKINKQLNNVNSNNIINYNIIALGHEKLEDVLTKKEKINEKFPQFKIILITNTQNNIGYKYDIKENKFVAIGRLSFRKIE
jgi:predicted nuclease with TOPRIM domain